VESRLLEASFVESGFSLSLAILGESVVPIIANRSSSFVMHSLVSLFFRNFLFFGFDCGFGFDFNFESHVMAISWAASRCRKSHTQQHPRNSATHFAQSLLFTNTAASWIDR
jgi:hypothetical protein